MIPKNLNEAIKELDKFVSGKNTELNGMGIRNSWGLWGESDLSMWFYNYNIFHADDMSSIIIESYRRMVNSIPIDLDEQISIYHNHWRKIYGENHIELMRKQSPIYKRIIERDEKIEKVTK